MTPPSTRPMNARAWVATLLLASATSAVAAEGPDVRVEHGKAATADASPVGAGTTEIEVKYALSWNERSGSPALGVPEPSLSDAVTGTITRGVGADVDVKLGIGLGTIFDAHRGPDGSAPRGGTGLGDAVVGARWRFADLSARAIELAVIAESVIPVGSRSNATEAGLSQEFWSARGALVASKDLGRWTTNAELAIGVPLAGDAGGLRSVGQVNVAAGYQLRPWLQPALELNYQHDRNVGVDAQVLAVTAEVVAPFGDAHRVVAAVQQGAWERNAGRTVAAIFAFKTAW